MRNLKLDVYICMYVYLQANLLAQSEAFMRQAESATVAARRLIAEKGETEQNAANENSDSKVCFLSAHSNM